MYTLQDVEHRSSEEPPTKRCQLSKKDCKSDCQSDKDVLHLLSCGYICKYFATKNINVKDIACIVVKFLFNDWKFDYLEHSCNQLNNKSNLHATYNNGKNATSDCDGGHRCYSLHRVSFGMAPNSGIYDIKMKIDKIGSSKRWSAIGITCDNYQSKPSEYCPYWGYSNDYVGWSSYRNGYNNTYSNMINGLLFGARNGIDIENNIFIKSKFVYKSNNQFYKEGLPYIKTGDTIIIKYNSNSSILSFFKANDSKLNAQICNLPKDKTFYWFVGTFAQKFSVTIVQ